MKVAFIHMNPEMFKNFEKFCNFQVAHQATKPGTWYHIMLPPNNFLLPGAIWPVELLSAADVHALLCHGYIISCWWICAVSLPLSIRVATLALGQSHDCPRASEVTLKDRSKMDYDIISVHYKVWTWNMGLFIGMSHIAASTFQ